MQLCCKLFAYSNIPVGPTTTKMFSLFALSIHFFPNRIIELNGGQPPLTYKRFQTLISRMDPPEMPVETMSSNFMGCCVTPLSEDHGDKYGVPSLEELGEMPMIHFFIFVF